MTGNDVDMFVFMAHIWHVIKMQEHFSATGYLNITPNQVHLFLTRLHCFKLSSEVV